MARRGRLTYQDGMTIWRTRDAYRVETALLAVFWVPQCLLAFMVLMAVLRGSWSQAVIYGVMIAMMHGLRWVVCTGIPRAVRWCWRVLRGRTGVVGLLLMVGLGSSGCTAHNNEWLGRHLSGLDCRPTKLDGAGRCVAAR